MSKQELLGYVVRILDHLGIPYLLSGSLASSLQGEPRATHDIDLVVELTREGLHLTKRVLPGEGKSRFSVWKYSSLPPKIRFS